MVSEALQVAADTQACADAFPPADAWKAEFPDLYREDPNNPNKFRVPYRNTNQTQFERERCSRKVVSMLGDWQKVSAETSERRCAGVETVRVRDYSGVVMEVPATQEAKLAAKGTVTPVASRNAGRRSYYTGGWLPNAKDREREGSENG